MEQIGKIIRPIVEGQIRSFLHDHPEVAQSWTGKLPNGKTKAMAIKDSLAKRITRDLLGESGIARMKAALVECFTAKSSGDDVEYFTASSAVSVKVASCADRHPHAHAFTFPLGWPNHYWTDLDVIAEITADDIGEISAHDYATNDTQPLSGQLESDVRQWLWLERRTDVEAAMDRARS